MNKTFLVRIFHCRKELSFMECIIRIIKVKEFMIFPNSNIGTSTFQKNKYLLKKQIQKVFCHSMAMPPATPIIYIIVSFKI